MDAVKAVLTTNAAAITPTGMSTVTIYERDDKPFKVADGLLELPILYVIPMADGKDSLRCSRVVILSCTSSSSRLWDITRLP